RPSLLKEKCQSPRQDDRGFPSRFHQNIATPITRWMTQPNKPKSSPIFLNGGAPVDELRTRQSNTIERIKELQSKLGEAEKLVSGKACVYATGSTGRLEASPHSDLDLFIVGKTARGEDGKCGSMLPRLDEICVKAELIQATRDLGIHEF